MSVFTPLPLGRRIPPTSVHAVSCSLPTMQDVIGYEEKKPETVSQMTTGYPRFVVHPYARQAASYLAAQLGLKECSVWLTSSRDAAVQLCAYLPAGVGELLPEGVLAGVHFKSESRHDVRAKQFLQHAGMFLSSREAEDFLRGQGQLSAVQEENEYTGAVGGSADEYVRAYLAKLYLPATPAEVWLAPSGMNAIYSAFRVANALQRARGRTRWLQLGWLYLDTIAVLQKFTGQPASDYLRQTDIFDLEALKQLFATQGAQLAGVIAEVPTNPLIQTPDLPALAALCRQYGVVLIVDPTIAGPGVLQVLPFADVVVTSLTKYTGSEGDVLLGAVLLNPASAFAAELRVALPGALEPVYARDLARLAAQISDTAEVLATIHRSASVVVDYLCNHPRVASVHWSQHPASREHYRRLATDAGHLGGMITFALNMPLAEFYDRLRLPKGPSFGMKTTLICPFMYLAHYDLVTSAEGRAELEAMGLAPELLRLSLGCEPVEEIMAALAEALA